MALRRVSDDEDSGGRRKSVKDALLGTPHFRIFGSSENVALIRRHIHLMDDRCINVEFTAKTLGRSLLKTICRHLRVMDSIVFFGIRYRDNDDVEQWLDLNTRVYKQIRDLKHHTLSLRTTFYPPSPLEEFKKPESKHLFYLQLRRDFHMGRLRTDPNDTYQIAAYAIQADHNLKSIPDGFDVVHIPGGLRVLPGLSRDAVAKIRSKLEAILWMSSEEAKDAFIRAASRVETYGMEPFQVTDQLGCGLCIGFNYMGISAFKNGQRTNIFPWETITKIQRSGKHLVIVLPRKNKEVLLGFKCKTSYEADLIWRRAVSCKYFSREAAQKLIYPDDEWVNENDQSNHSTNSKARQMRKFDVDLLSNSSQSSNDEAKSDISRGLPPKMVSKPPMPRFLAVPRHSLAAPDSVSLMVSRDSLVVPRDGFGGSMDLRSKAIDTEPHVVESKSSMTEPLYLITRSSINLSDP
ncbi:FERM domain-containing protein 5 [Fasciola hepatica]|uniref:FERM domain-containing protein 5 n=1 Tax=Fasciola hepatica TaxID=6192 RepID=A0A4E0RWT7_FASHE|nr:FERM domain-containing protein 5 [Fasciola hepatica]